MVKKTKYQKNVDKEQQKTPDMENKKKNMSDIFLDELQWAFTNFDKISESKRRDLYWNDDYLEQFWTYFKKEHPNLFDKMDKKDLPIYIQSLEDRGFSLTKILKKPETLQKEFGPEVTEMQVMQKSLEKLHDFCDDSVNNLPVDVFSKFASFAGFHANSHVINAHGKLAVIDDVYVIRKKFLDKENIILSDTAQDEVVSLLIPNYNPTERLIVEVALTKIRREFTGDLKKAFDQRFSLPITIFSPYQDILSFKDDWLAFLDQNKEHIDEKLAKKLDAIIVTNGDIRKLLEVSGKKFDDTRGFSEWEQYFRRIFNKLTTRQLFEEVQKKQETIDHYIDSMAKTFKEIPPYVNQIFTLYPFNDKEVSVIDTSFHTDIQTIDAELVTIENQYAHASDVERKLLRKKIRTLKEQKEERRWQAYIQFLRTKDASLADVFSVLVENKFDFSVLTVEQQQVLVDILVKNTLEDTIKNKVPELLSVTEEELTQFMTDLFDLQKMDIIFPTTYGPILLHFSKKEFICFSRTTLPGIDDLEKLKNLPLNFVADISWANENLFEKSVIFDSLYYDFAAKNGPVRINDAYKVKINKDGKEVEWYLSSYSPLDERNIETVHDGKELYLYTDPVTSPSQERTLVTREWPLDGTPVVIKDAEQWLCDVEVLDKQINLNGEALGALLFGYVLGQQTMNTEISPKKEEELAKKMWKLEVYKEKNESEELEEESSKEESDKNIETSPYKEFIHEWKQLKWHDFAEKSSTEDAGFVEWTRLFIPFADSAVYPKHEGKAWMFMDITHINKQKWTFTVKLHGCELWLGSHEGKTKELNLSASSLKNLKENFGDVYKLPNPKWKSMSDEIVLLQSAWITKDLDHHFGFLKWNGSKFVFVHGDYVDKEVTHFGLYESSIDESYDVEHEKNYTLYDVKYNANGTVSLSGKFVDGNVIKKYSRTMDYPSFLLFIKEKWLQPKSKEQANLLEKKQDLKNKETATTSRPFSISNVVWLFKNGFSKITDAIKKNDDEKIEDLTDVLTSQWTLYAQIGKFIPSARLSGAFEMMSVDYFGERDSRIWKKVEKWKKVYEDADFGLIYNQHIWPMIRWEKQIVPHYKAAAMLLAMISKGKWPYNRNPEFAAQGMRVNILMGKEHQQRYLAMREKLIRELHEWSAVHGSMWTDAKKNEIVELEMKYMVHTMDARQLGIQDGDKTKYYFYGKYSKQFVDELEKGYNWFFSQSTVEEWYGKVKWSTFDFARSEYFRLLGDRPQQAIPFLKTMATKAVNNSQWKVFESAVMTWILSGVFLTMTMSDTQGMIKNVCRTRWFVPGIWVKDINQQTKLQRLLDIFSGGEFSKTEFWKKKYSPNRFSFSDISWDTKNFISWFQDWVDKDNNLDALSNFLKLTGKDRSGNKTLIDIYSDEHTSPSDKALIQEFLANTNEKNEWLDGDVRKNPYAMSWSILTKGQSTVKEMMKIDTNGFVGADGDEKKMMGEFFIDMKKSIDTNPHNSSDKVKIYLDKFFNRFEERWFSLNNKTELIKRLKRCQQNPWKPEVDDILYYSIVGQVCHSFGRVSIPDEFHDALFAWKDFFKNNLDMILQPSILTTSFGWASYKQDYDKYNPKLEPRESCANLLDRDLRQAYLFQFPPEQRKLVTQNLTKLKSNKNYLNADLYDLADRLSRDVGIDNRFRKNVSISKQASTKVSSSEVTWAKIQNAQVVDKVRAILENKPIIDADDDYTMSDEYEDYDTRY